MTPLEKAIIDTCEKLHDGLSAVEDQTAENTNTLEQVLQKIDAQGVMLSDIMAAIGSLSDRSGEQYLVISEALSSLGARVRTSEQLMKVQAQGQRPIRVIERKRGKNESDER